MDHEFEDHAELDYPPLDVAVGLMAQGYDLNAIEGYPMFDPYFND